MMPDVHNVERETFSSLSQNTRTQLGHYPMKLMGGRFRTHQREDFFIQCSVNLWNSLPQDVAMATHLDGFKRGLDTYLEEKAMNSY